MPSDERLRFRRLMQFTQNLEPYNYLLWLMRGISSLFLANGLLRCMRYVGDIGAIE